MFYVFGKMLISHSQFYELFNLSKESINYRVVFIYSKMSLVYLYI